MQMAGLYSSNHSGDAAVVVDVTDVHQKLLMTQLGKLLSCLVTLDEIVIHQVALRDHWAAFKRVVSAAQLSPSVFGVELGQVHVIRKLLGTLEGTVMAGNLFKVGLFEPQTLETIEDQDPLILHASVVGTRSFSDVRGPAVLEELQDRQQQRPERGVQPFPQRSSLRVAGHHLLLFRR